MTTKLTKIKIEGGIILHFTDTDGRINNIELNDTELSMLKGEFIEIINVPITPTHNELSQWYYNGDEKTDYVQITVSNADILKTIQDAFEYFNRKHKNEYKP